MMPKPVRKSVATSKNGEHYCVSTIRLAGNIINARYETMVFACDSMGVVSDWQDIAVTISDDLSWALFQHTQFVQQINSVYFPFVREEFHKEITKNV